MTVAAVVLAAARANALRDVGGTPAVRRIVDAAWAGGATPVVVVGHDPDGHLARAVANTEATVVEPAAAAAGPAAQIVRGVEAAVSIIADTDAALLWPASRAWADAETVTTLIATHGVERSAVLRPTYEGTAGWPVLVPASALEATRAQSPTGSPDELLDGLATAGLPLHLVDTGDPGVTHEASMPRSALPPYAAPPRPPDTREAERQWGSAIPNDEDAVVSPSPASPDG